MSSDSSFSASSGEETVEIRTTVSDRTYLMMREPDRREEVVANVRSWRRTAIIAANAAICRYIAMMDCITCLMTVFVLKDDEDPLHEYRHERYLMSKVECIFIGLQLMYPEYLVLNGTRLRNLWNNGLVPFLSGEIERIDSSSNAVPMDLSMRSRLFDELGALLHLVRYISTEVWSTFRRGDLSRFRSMYALGQELVSMAVQCTPACRVQNPFRAPRKRKQIVSRRSNDSPSTSKRRTSSSGKAERNPSPEVVSSTVDVRAVASSSTDHLGSNVASSSEVQQQEQPQERDVSTPPPRHAREIALQSVQNQTLLEESVEEYLQSDECKLTDAPVITEEKEREYEIEEILDYKVQNHIPYFLIRWKGYDDSYNEWVPIHNCEHGTRKIFEFYRNVESGKIHTIQNEVSLSAVVASQRRFGFVQNVPSHLQMLQQGAVMRNESSTPPAFSDRENAVHQPDSLASSSDVVSDHVPDAVPETVADADAVEAAPAPSESAPAPATALAPAPASIESAPAPATAPASAPASAPAPVPPSTPEVVAAASSTPVPVTVTYEEHRYELGSEDIEKYIILNVQGKIEEAAAFLESRKK